MATPTLSAKSPDAHPLTGRPPPRSEPQAVLLSDAEIAAVVARPALLVAARRSPSTAPALPPGAIAASGPLSVATRVIRHCDRYFVTVIARATFTCPDRATMRLAPAEPARDDLIPFRGHIDLRLAGDKPASPGRTGRLAIYRNNDALFDRWMSVHRSDQASLPSTAPQERIASLRGLEWIAWKGDDPADPARWSRLPGARARLLVRRAPGAPDQVLELGVEAVTVDIDSSTCSLAFRGCFPLESAQALRHVRIQVDLDLPRRTTSSPSSASSSRGARVSGEGGTPASPDADHAADDVATDAPFASSDELDGPQPSFVLPPSSHDAALAAPDQLATAPTLPPPPHPPWRPTLPAAPPNAAPPPVVLTVEQCAAIAAELSEKRSSRAAILRAHHLTEASWTRAERGALATIEDGVKRGSHALRDAFDRSYIAAWERLRGGFGPEAYARLAVAVKGTNLGLELQAMQVERSLWMRLHRVWKQRIEADPALAAAVNEAMARPRIVKPP